MAAGSLSLALDGQVRVIIGDPKPILEGGLPKHLEVTPHAEHCASPLTDLSVFPSANTH